MEKWKSRAIGIGAAWVLLAFVSWHVESKCGVFFSYGCFSEFLTWSRRIILLKWIEPYQTLIAGLCAIAGGAFALSAAKLQTENQKKVADERDRSQMISGLYLVSNYFYRASTEHRINRGSGLSFASKAESLLPLVTGCSPYLPDFIHSAVEYLRVHEASKSKNRIPASVRLYATSCLFAEAAKYLSKRENGVILQRGELKFQATALLAYIEKYDGDKKDIGPLREFFDLSDD